MGCNGCRNSYAIIWDGKVRTDGYSIGTDDRTMREYITTQSRELKRRRHLKHLLRRRLKRLPGGLRRYTQSDEQSRGLYLGQMLWSQWWTRCDPLALSLGSDGLQRLFSTSGYHRPQRARDSG